MLGSLFERLLSCSHRRLTRPLTRVSKPGEASGETYVVCLDCGKQFAYDWDHMRIGKAIDRSAEGSVLKPEKPSRAKTKLKFALLGSAVPLGILLGAKLLKAVRGSAEPTEAGGPENEASAERFVRLPHGGPGAGFRVRELIEYIDQSGRQYIITGAIDCALADHPMPHSLDYWLRETYARNKESRQVTEDVIGALLATGLFEAATNLRCPDTGHRSPGLKLKARAGSPAERALT